MRSSAVRSFSLCRCGECIGKGPGSNDPTTPEQHNNLKTPSREPLRTRTMIELRGTARREVRSQEWLRPQRLCEWFIDNCVPREGRSPSPRSGAAFSLRLFGARLNPELVFSASAVKENRLVGNLQCRYQDRAGRGDTVASQISNFRSQKRLPTSTINPDSSAINFHGPASPRESEISNLKSHIS